MAIQKLSPFRLWVLQNFPFIAEDFDALTNYELMCKIVEYLNKVIDITNEQTGAINYLLNWFDNLDVQEEVDNKLDEMVESGQLQEIISAYLDSKAILGYNTIADLKSATNLVEGSITRTLGQLLVLDGKGAFYRIRGVLTTDVIDDYNKVSLTNYPSLIAEIIPNYFLDTEITNRTNADNSLQNQITTNEIKPTIFIGDSYADLFESNNWPEQVASKLGLTIGTNAWVSAMGGAGFVGNNIYYLTLLQNLANTISAEDKLKVKRIVVCGGLNDGIHGATLANIVGKMGEFSEYCTENYPNAKVYVGFIGWNGADNSGNRINTLQVAYLAYKQAPRYNMINLDGVEYIMHQYSLFGAFNDGTGDWSHPNETGMEYLSAGIYNAIENGSYSFTSQTVSQRLQDASAGPYLWTQILDNKLCVGITNTNFPSAWYNSLGTPSVGSQVLTLPKVKEGHLLRFVSTNQSRFHLNLHIKYTDNVERTYPALVTLNDNRELIVTFTNEYAHAITSMNFEADMLNLNALEF